MKSSNILFVFLPVILSYNTGFSQNVSFGISTQKACNSNRVATVVRVNGQPYTTDEFGASIGGSIHPGTYQVTASTPELPNTQIAYAEYWVQGTMEQKYYGDASGAVNVQFAKNGDLFIYLACDVKTIKVKIATTKSCTDAPNEGFSAQGGITVSIGNKTFTSNANGIIEAELPAGSYPVNAQWKDYALGYVAQNGLRQKKNEDGQSIVTLTDNNQTLEVRMLTCDLNAQAKPRAKVIEGNNIKVFRSHLHGTAFPGMQLRDGDTVWVTGNAKLNWLEGNATLSFEGSGRTIFIIGPDQNKPKGRTKIVDPGVQLWNGIMEFIHDPKDPDEEFEKFHVDTHSVAVGLKGTQFIIGYDEHSDVATIIVKEGAVIATPVNSLLKPFTLVAGQQVQVGVSYVGPISNTNTPNMTPDISGLWTMQDGQGGQLVQVTQNGNRATWSYKGGVGHENLIGNVTGTFEGKNFTGTYDIKEGYVTSSGKINLVFNADVLEGTWTASTLARQSGTYVMTKGDRRNTHATDLGGVWTLQDGQGGQLVQVVQNGNQVSWNYKGGRGHERLSGTVTGTFNGQNFKGTFSVREDNVSSDGQMNLVLTGDRLEGTWFSTTIAGQSGTYVMTRGNSTVNNNFPRTFNWNDNGRFLGTIEFFANGTAKVTWINLPVTWKYDSNDDLMIYTNGTQWVVRLKWDPNTGVYRGTRDVTSQTQDGVQTIMSPKM